MKAICLKKYIKDAISLCEKISGKNLGLLVLNNVLISTENKSIVFMATDLEIGINVEVPAKVEKNGKVAVPGSVVSSFLSNLDDENITIEAQNNNLIITTPKSSTIIKGQPTDDFPNLPEIKTSHELTFPVSNLISGIKSVWYAGSYSGVKPEISSVFVSFTKNSITFASTDSFRLAEKNVAFNSNMDGSLMIPLKSATEILRIFDGKDGNVKLSFNKNQLNIEMDNIKFVSRLIEGVFPDYQQIIPQKFTSDVIIDKNIFITTLRTAGIFSKKLNDLDIFVSSKEKSITIKTSSGEVGDYVSNIPAAITGSDIKMKFNHKYVFDCLQYISSLRVLLRFSGEGKPLLITGTEENTFQYLVMPMNL